MDPRLAGHHHEIGDYDDLTGMTHFSLGSKYFIRVTNAAIIANGTEMGIASGDLRLPFLADRSTMLVVYVLCIMCQASFPQ